MGKRSAFARVKNDAYATPVEAVLPLLPHLQEGTRFCEPCAGDGSLIDHLTAHGHVCASAWDIEPRREDIARQNALSRLIGNIDCFITNPPWDRRTLHPLIFHLALQSPAWLLFDADWIHTRQAAPYLPLLRRIVSVGRIKWIAGSRYTGKDNCCWYLFALGSGPPLFFGRAAE